MDQEIQRLKELYNELDQGPAKDEIRRQLVALGAKFNRQTGEAE